MRRSFVLAVAATAVALLAAQAQAATVVRHDPDDFEIAPDVHTTAKRVFKPDGGPWRLRISASGDLGPDYVLKVLLDTRGGPRADVVMRATMSELSFVACGVRRIGGAVIAANCQSDAFRAWWGVARRDLDHDKVIRWRIVARATPDFGGGVTDLAPDVGWYP